MHFNCCETKLTTDSVHHEEGNKLLRGERSVLVWSITLRYFKAGLWVKNRVYEGAPNPLSCCFFLESQTQFQGSGLYWHCKMEALQPSLKLMLPGWSFHKIGVSLLRRTCYKWKGIASGGAFNMFKMLTKHHAQQGQAKSLHWSSIWCMCVCESMC